jgi:hypothetical protein
MENWAWGLSLIPLTILIHATAIGFMALSGRVVGMDAVAYKRRD